jgi:hypothetical protein
VADRDNSSSPRCQRILILLTNNGIHQKRLILLTNNGIHQKRVSDNQQVYRVQSQHSLGGENGMNVLFRGGKSRTKAFLTQWNRLSFFFGRVTRLGEFSSIGNFFNLGHL